MKTAYMKKSPILLFLLIILHSTAVSSKSLADSLLIELEKASKNEKPAILNKLAWELRNSQPEKSIEYGLQSISIGEEIADFQHIAEAYSFVGVAFRILGNYSEALDLFYRGLELAKLHNLNEQEGYAYINIANLLIYQEFYTSALENLSKALEIARRTDNKQMLAYVYLNTGRAQMLKQEFDTALDNLFLSLKIRKDINNLAQQAVNYKYIGDAYFELKDYDEGLKNYELALKTVDLDSDQDLVANIYIKIADIYLYKQDFNKAKQNAEKSLAIARSLGARLIIRDSFRILSIVHKQAGNYEEAAEMMSCIIAYNDTLFNQKLSEKIFNLEYKYIKEIQEAEIDLLNKDIKINELLLNRTKLISISLVVILVLLTGILIYYLLTSKHRKKQNQLLKKQKDELSRANQTKDKMFLIIGHDLRGPVGSLIPLLDLLINEEEIKKNEKLVHIFNSFLNSVQQVSDLLENLLFWARNQDGELSYNKENINLNLIIEKALLLYKGIADLKQIRITIIAEKDYFVSADRNMVMLIIRNLISNAIKFTPREGEIKISLKDTEEFAEICISDTGVGFDQLASRAIFESNNFFTTTGTGNEVGSGLGLILCKEFIERNGGKIIAESEKGKGSKFYITIPSAG